MAARFYFELFIFSTIFSSYDLVRNEIQIITVGKDAWNLGENPLVKNKLFSSHFEPFIQRIIDILRNCV